ncbi:MAG: YggS family pyridoxal phosphate-dependent enzyme [Arenicella sp.]
MSNIDTHKNKLLNVQKRIHNACANVSRDKNSIQLIGASKTKSADLIRTFVSLGQTHFGENYLSEAIEKQANLTDLDITWHYIGQIQSNKTKLIASHFDWVHGVDRFKIAKRLNDQLDKDRPINILIQINLDNEPSKSGVKLNEALDLARQIQPLNQVRLRGLMALPKPQDNFQKQISCFIQLKNELDRINHTLNLELDTISAGMSNDLEAAIAAGSTMVRIGTDLFGTRT